MIQPMQVKETSLGKQLLLTEENKKEFLVNLTKAKKLAKKLNIRHNIEDIEPELVKKSNDLKELVKHDSEKNVSSNILSIPCFTPWFFMNICANGDVSTCGVHYKAINPDNTKIKTLKEIWKGNYFESVRQQLASKKVPKFCKNCCAMSVISFGRKMREKIVEIEKRRKQGIEATR